MAYDTNKCDVKDCQRKCGGRIGKCRNGKCTCSKCSTRNYRKQCQFLKTRCVRKAKLRCRRGTCGCITGLKVRRKGIRQHFLKRGTKRIPKRSGRKKLIIKQPGRWIP